MERMETNDRELAKPFERRDNALVLSNLIYMQKYFASEDLASLYLGTKAERRLRRHFEKNGREYAISVCGAAPEIINGSYGPLSKSAVPGGLLGFSLANGDRLRTLLSESVFYLEGSKSIMGSAEQSAFFRAKSLDGETFGKYSDCLAQFSGGNSVQSSLLLILDPKTNAKQRRASLELLGERYSEFSPFFQQESGSLYAINQKDKALSGLEAGVSKHLGLLRAQVISETKGTRQDNAAPVQDTLGEIFLLTAYFPALASGNQEMLKKAKHYADKLGKKESIAPRDEEFLRTYRSWFGYGGKTPEIASSKE
jgi:hypothetical protein